MAFPSLRPSEIQPGSRIEPLYGARWRLTHIEQLLSRSAATPARLGAWGTLYRGTASAGANTEAWANLRLIEGGFPENAEGVFVERTYETLTTTWTDEVAPVIDTELNGLKRITRRVVAIAGTSHTFAQGSSTYDGQPLALLKDESTDRIGRLTLVYLQPGQLSQTDDYSNNGALHVRSLTTFGVVPTTPEGFVFIGSQASETQGIPTRTYRFAKGTGEIDRDTTTSNNGALTRVTIRHLTAPDGTDPLASLSGYVRIAHSKAEADGHRVWTATFAAGTGEIDRDTSTSNNGALTRVTIRHLTAPDGTDPLASLSGYVRIAHSKAEADGHRVWTATFAAGTGTVSVSESPGPVAGTLSVRTVALTAPGASQPSVSGVLVDRDKREADGHLVWTLTAVTGTIIGTKLTYSAPYEVRTPGTVALTTLAVTAGDLSGTIAVANVTPPRTKTVAATVTLEITTSPPSTTTLAYDLGAISCSVTATSASYNFTGYDEGRTDSGDVRMSYPRRSASISANIQTFPNCYLSSGTSASGSFVYNAGAQYSLSSGGTILTETVRTSTEVNTLTGTGATSATGYATTGVLERKSRPVFTALDGTIYYEVITWSV